MKEISKSASYVQNLDLLAAEASKQAALRSICAHNPAAQQVWKLLETPQTLDSLARQLDDDAGGIKASLTTLIREELIQITPDS